MNQEHSIAIIIPAYKGRFLGNTLLSMSLQTNKDFCVYIGDDASTDDLKTIADEYSDKIDIRYHRFENNLGGKDLTAHWERCIALSSKEPIIWLFSDDDTMPDDAIQRILDKAAGRYEEDLFMRFPLALIDENNKEFRQNPPFKSECISGYQFLLDKLSGTIDSAACEYVFTRSLWNKVGHFVKFPVAWCSDDASWALLAESSHGIESVYGKPVYWRNATGCNISNSTNYNNPKCEAIVQFILWIHSFYGFRSQSAEMKKALRIYLHNIIKFSLQKNISALQLYRMCSAMSSISCIDAIRIYFRHIGYIF